MAGPDRENKAKKENELAGAEKKKADEAKGKAAKSNSEKGLGAKRVPGTRAYEVKPGESFETIAKSEFGDAKRAKDIAELNGMTVSDTFLEVTTISLPPILSAEQVQTALRWLGRSNLGEKELGFVCQVIGAPKASDWNEAIVQRVAEYQLKELKLTDKSVDGIPGGGTRGAMWKHQQADEAKEAKNNAKQYEAMVKAVKNKDQEALAALSSAHQLTASVVQSLHKTLSAKNEAGSGNMIDYTLMYTTMLAVKAVGMELDLKHAYLDLYGAELGYSIATLFAPLDTEKAEVQEKKQKRSDTLRSLIHDKVFYESQRDNTKAGDVTCNVTSLTMQLETLTGGRVPAIRSMLAFYEKKKWSLPGELTKTKKPWKDEDLAKFQLEDLLNTAMSKLKMNREWASDLAKMGLLLGDIAKEGNYYIEDGALFQHEVHNLSKPKDEFQKIALDMKGGGAISLGTKLTSGGHIVMLVDVQSDGVVINDPYGLNTGKAGSYWKNGAAPPSKLDKQQQEMLKTRIGRSNPALYAQMSTWYGPEGKPPEAWPHTIGERNFYSYEDVSKLKIGRWHMALKS